jgi:hypothetical protein
MLDHLFDVAHGGLGGLGDSVKMPLDDIRALLGPGGAPSAR